MHPPPTSMTCLHVSKKFYKERTLTLTTKHIGQSRVLGRSPFQLFRQKSIKIFEKRCNGRVKGNSNRQIKCEICTGKKPFFYWLVPRLIDRRIKCRYRCVTSCCLRGVFFAGHGNAATIVAASADGR